jgi:hypothetical protein
VICPERQPHQGFGRKGCSAHQNSPSRWSQSGWSSKWSTGLESGGTGSTFQHPYTSHSTILRSSSKGTTGLCTLGCHRPDAILSCTVAQGPSSCCRFPAQVLPQLRVLLSLKRKPRWKRLCRYEGPVKPPVRAGRSGPCSLPTLLVTYNRRGSPPGWTEHLHSEPVALPPPSRVTAGISSGLLPQTRGRLAPRRHAP